MKKILLVLLLLICGGCVNLKKVEDASLMITHQKSDTEISKNLFTVSDELELVKSLNDSLMKNEKTITYTTQEDIDLDEVVRLLSFLIPFDIKVTQSEYLNKEVKTYRINVEYTDTESEKVYHYLKKVIAENTKELSQNEKIDFAHQFILDHCEYDESVKQRDDSNASAFQIQGVLFDRKAVCSGYSRCFLLMMKLMDIPCIYVPSDVINHSFNLIYDGDYRFIDVTWDEGDNRYYNLDKNSFFKDGKHKLSNQFNSEYFVNFLSYIYHLK